MNFFNFGSEDPQSQSSTNFNLNEGTDFQFNQDTFGPNGYNQQEPSFVFSPQESKEPFQQNQFQFNFAESNHPASLNSSEPLCFQLTSQASFSDCMFGNDKSQEDQLFNSQTNFLDVKLKAAESKEIELNQVHQSACIYSKVNQPIQDMSLQDRSISVSNALKELESLMNKKTPTNFSLLKDNLAAPQKKENSNLVLVENNNQATKVQPLTKKIESKIGYFMNTCSQESQDSEQNNRKRLSEYVEEEKKCPKFENKYSEMKFFEKNHQAEAVQCKQNVKEINQTHFKQAAEQVNNPTTSNQQTYFALNSNSGTSSNTVINKQTVPTKPINQQQSLAPNIIPTNTMTKPQNQKNQPKSIVQGQRQSSSKNTSNNQAQHKNIKVNKRAMMPPIEEVTENDNESELDAKVNYEEKLKTLKEKFFTLQAKVNTIRQKSKQSSSLYDIFSNYISESENFKINFRLFFKMYLKNYNELLNNYSKLFLNLNAAHKIDKKCQELQSLFTKLKEKIPIN